MNKAKESQGATGPVIVHRPSSDALVLSLRGKWTLQRGMPPAEDVLQELRSSSVRRVGFDTEELAGWDSSLLTFLVKIVDHCRSNGIRIDSAGLPDGVKRLVRLAFAVPEKKDARRKAEKESFFTQVGRAAQEMGQGTVEMMEFLGSAILSLLRLFTGRARFRGSELAYFVQDCGAQALPIVTLISVLVGLILAFVGAVQLKMFGAQIYVANLVGLGMAREMGAMMAAIIMAGRTGAAFAAQLGTMQVNEEIDALKTLGISPMEFLVLPRMLALSAMMPLLCLYADFMGILGGFIVGVGMLDLSMVEYFNQTKEAVTLVDFSIGLVKSGIFGALVALAGCMRGMQCGRSASAVGTAATSAVVTSIVAIVVSDALLTVIASELGI